MLTDKQGCAMAVHFNENNNDFKNLEFAFEIISYLELAIEKVDLVNTDNPKSFIGQRSILVGSAVYNQPSCP